MTEKDKQEIIDSVAKTIQLVVNGKIDKLSITVAEIHARLDEQDKAMAPAIETIETLQNGRKFILWAVTPILTLGALVAMVKAYI